jgi:hypothetical protein
MRRRNPEKADQQCVRNHAKGHAQRAINQLRGKANRNEGQQIGQINCCKVYHHRLRLISIILVEINPCNREKEIFMVHPSAPLPGQPGFTARMVFTTSR